MSGKRFHGYVPDRRTYRAIIFLRRNGSKVYRASNGTALVDGRRTPLHWLQPMARREGWAGQPAGGGRS